MLSLNTELNIQFQVFKRQLIYFEKLLNVNNLLPLTLE